MPTVEELGQKVKAKYPGAYDDIADADLGRKVKTKYPGAYDDFTDEPKTTKLETAAIHGLQGATYEFGDELAGAMRAAQNSPADWLYEKLHPEDPTKSPSAGEQYQAGKQAFINRENLTRKEHPGVALSSNIGGRVASDALLAMMGVPAPVLAVGGGALSGVGASDGGSVSRLAGDAGLGALFGGVGYGASAALGKVAGKTAGWARGKVAGAQAKAATQAVEEAGEKVASLKGQYGKSKEVANRIIENLVREEAAGTLTPANAALLASLKKSPEWGDIVNTIVANNLADAPGTIADQAAKKAAYQAAQAAMPADIAARTAQLSLPQVKADAKTFIKAYAEPAAWAYGANKLGDALGLDPETNLALTAGAGIIGGRTRAGKALMTRITRPGNQIAWGNKLAGAAEGFQRSAPWVGVAAGQGLAAAAPFASTIRQAMNPVPSPRELAQADPAVGEAYQKGGPSAAAATFYSEAQKRPDQLLHWLNDPQP